jgi:hypothetical protein
LRYRNRPSHRLEWNYLKKYFFFQKKLTFGEPVFRSFVISVHQWLTLFHVIRCFIKHAILETLSQNVQDLVVNKFIASPLLVGFKHAHLVINIALIDGWNTTVFLVIPWILFTVWFDDFFYEKERKLRNLIFVFKAIQERFGFDDFMQLARELTYICPAITINTELRYLKGKIHKPRNHVTGASIVLTTASANACMGFLASRSGILKDVSSVRHK